MSIRDGWGQRRIKISPEAIEAWMVGGKAIVTNLPDDARFVRMFPSETGDCYYLVFESAAWDELAEGEKIPEFDVEVRDKEQLIKIEATP